MANFLKINEIDNVAVALKPLLKGESVCGVTLVEDIPQGHKFALKDIKVNENVIKYGYPIAHADKDIKVGEHVHNHNVSTNLGEELEYVYKPNFKDFKAKKENRLVKVYKRFDGKFGIRNNLLIVPLVGCVNSQAETIKKLLLQKEEAKYADEIIVTKHPYGCSQLGDDHQKTVDILHSIVKHPNNGGVLVFALGCENNQIEKFKESLGKYDVDRIRFLKAQDFEDEIEEGIKLCLELLDNMSKDKRVETSINNITIGLKCGGSDGLSGITANPLLGRVSDYMVVNGGSTILSEVPEMFGAEQVLMERADNKETFNKIVKLINGFKGYYRAHNQVCYENPSPGNKQGGITTLEDKSLGCVQKAGSSLVRDVLYEGEEVKIKGLNLLNGPGNDMVACTNIACSGAHLILFTTGRGTPFGTFIPTVKVSTNTPLAEKKKNWIDFNAGQIVDGKEFDEVTDEFIEFLVKVINGEIKTCNEKNDFQEIAIFKDGVTL